MDPLIVSFVPGASGRFISTICLSLINTNEPTNLIWTPDNTAHNHDVHKNNSYWENVPANLLTNKMFGNTDEVYNYIKLLPNTVLHTHAFPNFEKIAERVKDCKIIIIGLNPKSFEEVYLNALIKNKQNIVPFDLVKENKIYKWKKFIDLNIPNQYQHMVQVIMYDEIFASSGNSFVGLEKIKSFLSVGVPDSVLHGYKSYVDSRSQLLQKYNIKS